MFIRHHPVFRRFRGHIVEVPKQFHVDYVGVQVRWEYTKQNRSAISLPIAPPHPDEEYFEWIDLLEAVDEAVDGFCMLELGANWGRWGLRGAAAARQRGLSINIGFAEAEPVHLEWLQQSLQDNGVTAEEAQVYPCVVSGAAGNVQFLIRNPRLAEENDPRIWAGQHRVRGQEVPESVTAAVIGDEYAARYQKYKVFRYRTGSLAIEVPQMTLSTILERYHQPVDLIDMDIQGEEAEVVAEALPLLTSKVRRMHIGTHARDIEDALKQMLGSLGWQLQYSYPCHSTCTTVYGEIAFVDGVQSWKNPYLTSPRNIGEAAASTAEDGTLIHVPLELIQSTQRGTLRWHEDGILLITDPQQYAFSAFCQLDLSAVSSAAEIILSVTLRVNHGQVGVGWFDREKQKWIVRKTGLSGQHRVELVVPLIEAHGQLVFDNCAPDGPSTAVIREIDLRPNDSR